MDGTYGTVYDLAGSEFLGSMSVGVVGSSIWGAVFLLLYDEFYNGDGN